MKEMRTTVTTSCSGGSTGCRPRQRRKYNQSYNNQFFDVVSCCSILLLITTTCSTTGRFYCYGMIHDVSVRLQSYGSSPSYYYYIDYHEGLSGDTIEINLSDLTFLSISSVVSALQQQDEGEEVENTSTSLVYYKDDRRYSIKRNTTGDMESNNNIKDDIDIHHQKQLPRMEDHDDEEEIVEREDLSVGVGVEDIENVTVAVVPLDKTGPTTIVSSINDDEVLAFTKFLLRQKQQQERRNHHEDYDDDGDSNTYIQTDTIRTTILKNPKNKTTPSPIIANDDEVTAYNTFLYNIDYYSKILEQDKQNQQPHQEGESNKNDNEDKYVDKEQHEELVQQQQQEQRQDLKNEPYTTRNTLSTNTSVTLPKTTTTHEIGRNITSTYTSFNTLNTTIISGRSRRRKISRNQRKLAVDSTSQKHQHQYIDILVFSITHPISQTTNWIDHGIGHYDTNNKNHAVSFCCTEELIEQAACLRSQRNRLIINSTHYNGYYKSVSIPIDDSTKFQRQMKYDTNAILTFHRKQDQNNDEFESYVVLFANCYTSVKEQTATRTAKDILVTGTISYKSEKGYLSRTLDSLQFFYFLIVPICIYCFIQYTFLPMIYHYNTIYWNYNSNSNLRRSRHSSRYYPHYSHSPYKNTITDVVCALGILQSVMKVLYYYVLNESGFRLDCIYWISIAIGILYKLGNRLIPVLLCRTGQSMIPFYNNIRMESGYRNYGDSSSKTSHKPKISPFSWNVLYFVLLRLFIVLLVVNDVLLGYNSYRIASSSVVSSLVPSMMTVVMVQRGCEFSMYLIYTIVGSLANTLRRIDEQKKQHRSASASVPNSASKNEGYQRLELLGYVWTLSAIITIGMAIAGLVQLVVVRRNHATFHQTTSSIADHFLLSFWHNIETYSTFHTNSILKSIYADEIDCLANIILLLLFLRKPASRYNFITKKYDDSDGASTVSGNISDFYVELKNDDVTDYTEDISDSSDGSSSSNDEHDDDAKAGMEYTILSTSSRCIRTSPNTFNNTNSKRRTIMKHTSSLI